MCRPSVPEIRVASIRHSNKTRRVIPSAAEESVQTAPQTGSSFSRQVLLEPLSHRCRTGRNSKCSHSAQVLSDQKNHGDEKCGERSHSMRDPLYVCEPGRSGGYWARPVLQKRAPEQRASRLSQATQIVWTSIRPHYLVRATSSSN